MYMYIEVEIEHLRETSKHQTAISPPATRDLALAKSQEKSKLSLISFSYSSPWSRVFYNNLKTRCKCTNSRRALDVMLHQKVYSTVAVVPPDRPWEIREKTGTSFDHAREL